MSEEDFKKDKYKNYDKILLFLIFILIFGLTIPLKTITMIDVDIGKYSIDDIKTSQHKIPVLQYYNLKYSEPAFIGRIKLNITVVDNMDAIVFNANYNLTQSHYTFILPTALKEDYTLIMELKEYPQEKKIIEFT